MIKMPERVKDIRRYTSYKIKCLRSHRVEAPKVISPPTLSQTIEPLMPVRFGVTLRRLIYESIYKV